MRARRIFLVVASATVQVDSELHFVLGNRASHTPERDFDRTRSPLTKKSPKRWHDCPFAPSVWRRSHRIRWA